MAKAAQNWRFWYFLLAWLLLPIVKFMIRTFGFQNTCQKLMGDPFKELPLDHATPGTQTIELATSIQRSVLQAGRFWPDKRNNCLQRASVACFLLRSKKIPCKVEIGVKGKKTQPQEYAHAWIEVLGQPIGESRQSLENYLTFCSISKHDV
jgi:hypothetical protein